MLTVQFSTLCGSPVADFCTNTTDNWSGADRFRLDIDG